MTRSTAASDDVPQKAHVHRCSIGRNGLRRVTLVATS
jgi:hypothetical protein